ncbi:anthranilate phosphoribosyltransferase [Thermaurantiacus sp.]
MTRLPDPARPMDAATASACFAAILDGQVEDAELGRFLQALAARGETAVEIAAAAAELRARMVKVAAPDGAIDLCGTGGDGSHSLNVSTAAAFVVAAAGVPVAKHGNRASSSRCGAADVLEALGARLDLGPARLEACLAEVGLVFLFAPAHHPALARVAPVRRALGVRTIFNLLGPLANPAGVRRQLVGVFAAAWMRPMAEAVLALGGERVVIVHGGGLDELAVDTPSVLLWAGPEGLVEDKFDAAAHGLGPFPREAIAGGDAAHNAAMLKAVLAGDTGTEALRAYRAIVVANAAAALRLAGRSEGWGEAIALAKAVIDEGRAGDRLARLLAFR